MKNINKKIRKESGYAILFAVVVISVISLITIGLSNAAYKQIILSSVARDSTTAFYQADIASECALYFDNENSDLNSVTPGSVYSLCAETNMTFGGNQASGYTLTPDSTKSQSTDKCFRITINKTINTSVVNTSVDVKGYNICNVGNTRTVERAINVSY